MATTRVFSLLILGLSATFAVPTEKPTGLPRPVIPLESTDLRDGFGFPFFANLFAPLWNIFPTFLEIGPEVKEDDTSYQIAIKVKGYNKSDLTVRVKNGFIFAQGAKEASPDSHDLFASQFIHTYSLPVNSSAEEVTAELTSDAYLVIRAPITNKASESSRKVDRLIEIKETGTPYKKEEKPVKEQPAAVKPVEDKTEKPGLETLDEDRKESTTKSDEKEVTEKDNSIPHGDESGKKL